jgi:hypothetical protein
MTEMSNRKIPQHLLDRAEAARARDEQQVRSSDTFLTGALAREQKRATARLRSTSSGGGTDDTSSSPEPAEVAGTEDGIETLLSVSVTRDKATGAIMFGGMVSAEQFEELLGTALQKTMRRNWPAISVRQRVV